jgi:hypothetical protein
MRGGGRWRARTSLLPLAVDAVPTQVGQATDAEIQAAMKTAIGGIRLEVDPSAMVRAMLSTQTGNVVSSMPDFRRAHPGTEHGEHSQRDRDQTNTRNATVASPHLAQPASVGTSRSGARRSGVAS